MAKMAVLMLMAASFLMGCTINEAGANLIPRPQVINLGGKVMCQDCTKSYQEWVQGSQPIKGLIIPRFTFKSLNQLVQ